jgi:hypothetical protein
MTVDQVLAETIRTDRQRTPQTHRQTCRQRQTPHTSRL